MANNYVYPLPGTANPYQTNPNMMSMSQQNSYQGIQQDFRQQQTQQQFGLKGRPVSSFEEVRGILIDFDGSVFYFPDIANKRIYTKQIGMDGSAIFNVYELKPMPAINNSDFITRTEFEKVLSELKNAIITSNHQIIQPIQSQTESTQKEEPLSF